MDKKEKILDLYYNKHLKQIQIANEMDLSQQYISKIVKKDERYDKEKNYRKSANCEKRKVAQAEYQKRYIRKREKDIIYEKMIAQQKQDAMELSYNTHNLSIYALRKANSSIYRYDKKNNQYVKIKGIKTSIDLPRRISMNTF